MALLKWLDEFLHALVYGDAPMPQQTPPNMPINEPPPPEPVTPPLLWDTPANVRHSIRVLCDELGFTLEQKNTMCATIQAESGFNTHARLDNKKNGVVWSTDWGVCQWNSYWHWEKTKEISPEEAVNNPEKAVRLMCKYWKAGLRNQWVAYSSGAYKRYL